MTQRAHYTRDSAYDYLEKAKQNIIDARLVMVNGHEVAEPILIADRLLIRIAKIEALLKERDDNGK